MRRLWIGLGGLAGLGTVALSAFAAHGLGRLDPAEMRMMQSAIQMQGWHALALLATGLWAPNGGWLTQAAGAAFAAGLLLFCGAIYALALAHLSVGPLAPIGGTMLMLGWGLLAASALRRA